MSTRWRLAATLALAAAAGLLCAACDSEAVSTPRGDSPAPTAAKPSSGGVVFVGEEFETIRLEVEDAVEIVSDKTPDGKPLMRVVAAPGASGGKCIWIPDKAGCPEPDKGHKFARAVFRFTVKKAGLYTFWCRRKWCDPPQCGDTFAIRFDREGQPRNLEKTEHLFGSDDTTRPPRWGWSPVYQKGQPRRFFLTAGEHVLEFLNREDGPRADVILLTDDRDYVPQGMED